MEASWSHSELVLIVGLKLAPPIMPTLLVALALEKLYFSYERTARSFSVSQYLRLRTRVRATTSLRQMQPKRKNNNKTTPAISNIKCRAHHCSELAGAADMTGVHAVAATWLLGCCMYRCLHNSHAPAKLAQHLRDRLRREIDNTLVLLPVCALRSVPAACPRQTLGSSSMHQRRPGFRRLIGTNCCCCHPCCCRCCNCCCCSCCCSSLC